MSDINIGDVLFQLSNLLFLVLIIILIVSFFRSNKIRRNQLNRIEGKVDVIMEQIKKGDD